MAVVDFGFLLDGLGDGLRLTRSRSPLDGDRGHRWSFEDPDGCLRFGRRSGCFLDLRLGRLTVPRGFRFLTSPE
jgi:hypothetical protein